MVGSENQADAAQHDDPAKALRSLKEWVAQKALVDRKASSGENSNVSPSISASGPSIVPKQRAIGEKISDGRPSRGRRVFRTFASGVVVAALVAVAWQAFQDKDTKKNLRAWGRAPLTWLSTLSGQNLVGQNLATATGPKSMERVEGSTSVGADASPEMQSQLRAAVNDLAIIRQTLQQIASKQEQMAQDIAALQAVGRDINQRVFSLSWAVVHAQLKNGPNTVQPPEPGGQPASAPLPVVSRPPVGTARPAQ